MGEMTYVGIKINNLSAGAVNYTYWVLRLDDGAVWYYGAYDDHTKAQEVADGLGNGFVVEN